MIIDHHTLDTLTAQTKASPRLRMNLDLRNRPEDHSQRMLNAIEPGTVLAIHQHMTTSETVVYLQEHFVEFFSDANGQLETTTSDAQLCVSSTPLPARKRTLMMSYRAPVGGARESKER